MSIGAEYRPTGIIDSDSDPIYVNNGNFIHAKNVRAITHAGGTGIDQEIILGAEGIFSVGEASAQSMAVVFELINAEETPLAYEYSVQAGVRGDPIVVGWTDDTDQETSVDNFVSELNTALTAFGGVVELTRTYTGTNTARIEISFPGYYDWIFNISNIPVTLLYISQEAIPLNYGGPLQVIWSKDYLGKSFIFSAVQPDLPVERDVIYVTDSGLVQPIEVFEAEPHGLSTGDEVLISGILEETNANGRWIITVTSPTSYTLDGTLDTAADANVPIADVISNGVPGLIRIQTTVPHNFTTGQRVSVAGVGGTVEANGIWVITVISDTLFDLVDSIFVNAYTTGGTATKVGTSIHGPRGVGEIGVTEKNNDGTWTYYRLLRSVEFNYRIIKQIDGDLEYQNGQYNIYYTDDYNVPRKFYYKGAFENNGALNFVNPLNVYEYGSIAEQSRQIVVNPVIRIDYGGQPQNGGQLLSGNWRYCVRLLDDSLSTTEYSILSNPINVTSLTSDNPYIFKGVDSGVTTGKANILEISGINEEVFSYIELAALNYLGGSVSGVTVGRFSITGDTMTITHYGNELSSTPLSPSEIEVISQVQNVRTVGSIRLLDNRQFWGNIQTGDIPNLTAWAQEINYNIKSDSFDGVGDGGNFLYNEYMRPENVFYRTSYMFNETYRFGVRLHDAETGVWTPAFHIIDITFDTTMTDPRRLSTVSNYDLTSNPGSPPARATVNYIYLSFENINWDYPLADGRRLRDVYDKVEFVRAEVDVPTILGTGIAFPKHDSDASAFVLNRLNNKWYFRYVNGGGGYAQLPTDLYSVAVGPTDVERRYGALYFPDFTIGGTPYAFQSGDLLYAFGNPTYMGTYTRGTTTNNTNTKNAVTADIYGALDSTFQTLDITAVVFPNGRGDITVGSGTIRGEFYAGPNNLTISGNPIEPCYFYELGTGNFITSTNPDYGVYYVQVYRPNANQYPAAVQDTKYISIGAVYDIDVAATQATEYDVYGGDTFNQKTYLRVALGDYDTGSGGINYGKIIGFYSQNRINSQMRFSPQGQVVNQCIYPGGITGTASIDDRINQVTFYDNHEPLNYQHGYDYTSLGIQAIASYDPNTIYIQSFEKRIMYSQLKPQGSLTDFYRQFLPFDFADLPFNAGELIHLETFNGEMYSWQQRCMARLYVNSRATLRGGDDSPDIIVGNGAVLQQVPMQLSSYGTLHKFSVIKLFSTVSGKDILFWINTEYKKMIKFSGGGTDSIGDIKNITAFLAHNLTWANEATTPAYGNGICGITDERYGEAIVTVRAWRPNIEEYDNATEYSLNDVVQYADTPFYQFNFEGIPIFYQYINPTPTSGNNPLDTDYWERIPYADTGYYNLYTLCYNERKGGFTAYYTFLPKIFIKNKASYLSPSPAIGNESSIYEHDRGNYCRWYAKTATSGTGTISHTQGSTTITGTGTDFTGELKVGFGILTGGYLYLITEIVSDTEVTIDTIVLDSDNEVVQMNTIASITGVEYQIVEQQIEHASVTSVINYDPKELKTFEKEQYVTDIPPYYVEYETKNQESFLIEDDFVFDPQNNRYRSTIKLDSTGTGINSGGSPVMRGLYLKAKLIMRYLLYQNWNGKITHFRYKFKKAR